MGPFPSQDVGASAREHYTLSLKPLQVEPRGVERKKQLRSSSHVTPLCIVLHGILKYVEFNRYSIDCRAYVTHSLHSDEPRCHFPDRFYFDQNLSSQNNILENAKKL